MSSTDSKRSKRRRNKRGGANRPVPPTNSSNGNAQCAKADGQVVTPIPVPSALTELDLDNISQPLSQMPRSHNPYLDREHCLLCRRERPDPPSSRLSLGPGLGPGNEKENNRQLPISQMPLWLCPECRHSVEEEEANSTKGFDPSAIGELLLQPSLPLITSLQNLDVAFTTSPGVGGDSAPSIVTTTTTTSTGVVGKDGRGLGVVGGGGEGPCQCEPCRERREIAAEQEHSRQQLGECWTELSHLVRCVYWEAGTSLTGEESTTKLSLPRMQELVRRLCAHDPHLLYVRLEAEVEDFVKEMRERLLRQLEGGFHTPPLAKQFVTTLLEEYAALCSAAQTLLSILEELEKEHLQKFNLTWPLHNKHLFHSLIYMEPGLHDNLGTLIKQLRAVTSQKEPYHEESYASLLQRYLQFDNDMSVVAVVWRDCQQLIEDYTDEQELYKGKEALNRSWDVGVPSSRPRPLSCEATKLTNNRNLYPCQSALIGHLANGGGNQELTTNHKGSTKKKCLCDDCSLNRLTSSLLTPDLYEEIGLKHLSEAASGGQLSALDSYLQSINPPDLSSTTSSSECSSQGDSEEVIPIFSRNDFIHTSDFSFGSPRSDDSDDSDDLDSESSPSPSHENAFEEDDDDRDGHQNENSSSRGRGRCQASASRQGRERQSNGDLKRDSTLVSSQPCECSNCSVSSAGHLPSGLLPTGLGEKLEVASKPSYLFYPNLPGHQPLDLSHHGITAKHPVIHPHLYNLTSSTSTAQSQSQSAQKPPKLLPHHHHAQQQAQPQAFQLGVGAAAAAAADVLQAYGDWNSAYESAKMVLHSHSHYGREEEAPDLVQSVKAALQSNCRSGGGGGGGGGEKTENRSVGSKPSPAPHEADGKVPASKEEKGSKHCLNGGGGGGGSLLMSNGIGEWTKQQRLAHHVHPHPSETLDKRKSAGLAAAVAAQELCAKHNLPAVPKLPGSNLFFPAPLLDAAGGVLGGDPLTQPFGQGVLTQQALMTQGVGLQLQNAGIHMADVHHLQHQQQQQQQHQHQHMAGEGKKKKKSLGGEESAAEPTVRLPDYLNEQHMQACSHQHPVSHAASGLGNGASLCNSSMQTTASTPTSASVCSSEPDYETPNYQHEDDTPSNNDDKDSNASSTTRERESKHCECCYCEFFGQGPQPAPTSRNYTEIRDRLRLRLRERKPKDHSPSHEPLAPQPPSDLLHADERKVEDLLSFIEGAKKSKTSSKAAKRQRQRQKKAEQKSKTVPENGHKKEHHVPMSLHHHHYHHHHHHVEVKSGEAPQQHHGGGGSSNNVVPDPKHQHHNLVAAAPKQGLQPHPQVSAHHPQPQPQSNPSPSPATSKGQPRPLVDHQHGSPAWSSSSPSPVASSSSSTSVASSDSSKSTSTSSSSKAAPAATVQDGTSSRAKQDSAVKKAKTTPASQPQVQPSTPSSNGVSKSMETKAKGKENGAGKHWPSLSLAADSPSDGNSSRDQQESSQPSSRRDQGNKQAVQHSQQQQQKQPVQQPKHQQQQKERASRQDSGSSSWKTVHAGPEKMVNGHASDTSSSSSSSRSNSVGNKSHVGVANKGRQHGSGTASSDDPHLKKAKQGPAPSAPLPAPTHSTKKATPLTTTTGLGEDHTPHHAPKVEQRVEQRLASKRTENNHHTKPDTRLLPRNGPSHDPLPNGSALTNGNGTTNKRRKKKKHSSDNPNASIDEIFMPKENVDMNDMDETERELEAFKRFCMASTPQPHKEKVVFNIKDLALKKSSLQAH